MTSYDLCGPGRGTYRRTAPDLEASNTFPETKCVNLRHVADWSFLTNHARVLLCIAHDPGARLRDIADILGITERRAHGIITDLTEAGYVVKRKDGRRNRYEIQASLPLPEPGTREPAVGEVLAVLLGTPTALPGRQTVASQAGSPTSRAIHPGVSKRTGCAPTSAVRWSSMPSSSAAPIRCAH